MVYRNPLRVAVRPEMPVKPFTDLAGAHEEGIEIRVERMFNNEALS
jgi:hypothetical protein